MSVHNSMYLITLDSPKITGFQNKHSMKILDNMDVDCGMYSTFMEENSTFMEDHKKSCPRMHFLRCRAVWIPDGYDLSDLMERAQNSDSITHVKK